MWYNYSSVRFNATAISSADLQKHIQSSFPNDEPDVHIEFIWNGELIM